MKNKKYKVFHYVAKHDNRVPRSEVETKFSLSPDYLDGFIDNNLGKEMRCYDGVLELTGEGEEYVQAFEREKRFPLRNTIIASAVSFLVGALLERIFGLIRMIWP